MDSTLFSFLLASILLLLLPLLLLKNNNSRLRQATADPPPPPGPWNLPIIGSLHHLLGRQIHHSLDDLAKRFGPIMLLRLGEVPTLIVSSAEAAAEITKAQDHYFASRPMIQSVKIISYGEKTILFAPYGPYWRELRKLAILELLSAKRVKSFRAIREEEMMKLVKLISVSGLVNLSNQFVVLTNDISARAIIGSKGKYQKEFLRILAAALQAAGAFNLADLFPSAATVIGMVSGMTSKLRRLHLELDAILGNIIEEHKKKEGDEQVEEEDMVDVMLQVQREGTLSFPFTDESIKAIITDLFGAGSETSAAVMEWVMSELMRNPRVMRRVQEEVREKVKEKGKVTEDDVAEMSYLKLVVKETMRLHPPLPLLVPRECQEPREVLGCWIPAKTRVLINAWALGRSPLYWDNAAEFWPERFDAGSGGSSAGVDMKGTNFEFLPFGAGRRMCPGMVFGLANVELPLAFLLYYFDWEMPEVEATKVNKLDMEEVFVFTCRRKSELHLRAIPHRLCFIDCA